MPKIKPPRISGTGYSKSDASRLQYKRQAADGTYEIDTDTIADTIDAYFSDHEGKKQSYVALRLALKISRATYIRWMSGYINPADAMDDRVIPHTQLQDIMRAGHDRIIRYLVESDSKYGAQKEIRLLETMGEINPSKQVLDANITTTNQSLGKYRKWAK